MNLAPDRADQARRERLLVVEDDRLQRLLVSEVASQVGFDVDGAASILEARHLLARHAYRSVIIDLSLGDGDGIEILRCLAALEERPSIVIMSGFDERVRDSVLRLARLLGLATLGALSKPLDLMALRASLAGTLVDGVGQARPGPPAITREQLDQAISAGQITTVYQPKIDLQSNETVGVEALARWHSPLHGPVPPDLFVGLAERWGLVDDLTGRVMHQAITDAVQWRRLSPNFNLAVNVPASMLSRSAFPEALEDVAGRLGLPLTNLTIEVTEQVAMSDAARIGEVLTRLRIKGVQLSIDDFGTGYSSLQALLSMPFGELKVDRGFVQCCDSDPYAWKIVRATLSLAREFGMTCVAEGIESETVCTMLSQAGCDYGQGYLFSQPRKACDIQRALFVETSDTALSRREQLTLDAQLHRQRR
jgi:EAL domain-containing protein (putative c-di-GMP-specific phosphodiesterase class I)/ActR/RegA family two-component response regulator